MNVEEKVGFERRWYTKIMDRYRWSSYYIPYFNEAARTALRLKSFLDHRAVARRCRGQNARIDEWYNQLKLLFFGFSSVRCGTVFLTNMLKLEIPDSHFEHEANVLDYWNLPNARSSEDHALRYLGGYRRNEIYCRAPHEIAIYGEINPFLRRHCQAVKSTFPEARLFHLVRDPRDVVRSIMQREILSKKDPMGSLVGPMPSDPYFEQWSQMNRFERVCWEWQDDNRYIRQHVKQRIRFEDMMNDYDEFKRKLLDYLGLELSEKTWSAYVNRPRNASRMNRFPHWSEWNPTQCQAFERICGAEMSVYGYSM